MIRALRGFLKETDMMAYLVMIANRLIELHRVLKPTGSIYLHCDPTASHYLKIVMDAVFGIQFFKNEIIWKRTTAHNDPSRWGRVHDVLLFYSKSENCTWNNVYLTFEQKYIDRFHHIDKDGRHWADDNLTAKGLSGGGYTYEYKGFTSLWRIPLETMKRLDAEDKLYFTKSGGIRVKRYLDELPGLLIQDVITDISPINSQSTERLGYPTQKPLTLLERIIQASSNPGDIVLDPFCGCGTAVHSAQKLGRRWVGIDITNLAIGLIERRLKEAFPGIVFEVHGTPKDLEGACDLVGAQPFQNKKKGADAGIDGLIFFQDDKGAAKKIIVSVKGGGHVGRTMIADLKNSVEREGAKMGLFVSLVEPTEPMVHEAVSAGYYESPLEKSFPKIQILTIEGLLSGKQSPQYPDLSRGGLSFKKAKTEAEKGKQPGLF